MGAGRAKPDHRHRHSNRLQDYDYGQAGAYFVTVCTHKHVPLLAQIRDGEAFLSAMGQIVEDEWRRTPQLRQNVTLDEYVTMPNHVHGILLIADNVTHGQPRTAPRPDQDRVRGLHSPSQTIGAIVRGFKGATTSHVRKQITLPGGYLWQMNYYDHIIRNDQDMQRIREYIVNNPASWELDRFYRQDAHKSGNAI